MSSMSGSTLVPCIDTSTITPLQGKAGQGRRPGNTGAGAGMHVRVCGCGACTCVCVWVVEVGVVGVVGRRAGRSLQTLLPKVKEEMCVRGEEAATKGMRHAKR